MSRTHESDHAHGPDCACGCHSHDHSGDPAQRLLDGALILSRSWRRTGGPPVSAAGLERQVTAGLRQIAGLLAEDGAVFGHIKALLRCGEDSVTLSITRLDAVDHITVGCWPPSAPVEECALTVNVLSLAHTESVTDELLERLFGTLWGC